MRNLTFEQANKYFGILVDHAGASEDQRTQFLHYMMEDDGVGFKEWRFGGYLGFGGKAKMNHSHAYVTCYQEDETPERRAIITTVNELLKDLI